MVWSHDWSTPDKVKYFVSVQSTLHPTEIERFRLTPAFPKEKVARKESSEGGTLNKVSWFKASDLYEPLNVFRTLGLPTIDWRARYRECKWNPNSEEGTPDTAWLPHVLTLPFPAKFLFNLGLRRYPPTEVILGIASKGEPLGTVALGYFLDNYIQKYADYTIEAHPNIAFVPAVHRCERKLAKPLEVFSNPDWQPLGFPTLDADLDPDLRRDAVSKLKIKEHPPTDQIVRLLETSPPSNEAHARQWFGVLSRCISGMCDTQPDERLLIFPRLPCF